MRGKTLSGKPDDRKRVIAAAGLLLAVVAVLLLGAFLQSDREREAPGARLSSDDARLPPEEQEVGMVAPQPQPEVAAERAVEPPVAEAEIPELGERELSDLGHRALADRRRLAREPESWTLKLATVCDPSNARRLLRLAGGADRFHLLPHTLNDRSCFRACWGTYATRDAAARAKLPPALAAEKLDRQPIAVGSLLQ